MGLCPTRGSAASRWGTRPIIVLGLSLQASAFIALVQSSRLGCGEGGSCDNSGGEILSMASPAAVFCFRGALVLFGLGEGFAMTPVMEDLMQTVVLIKLKEQEMTVPAARTMTKATTDAMATHPAAAIAPHDAAAADKALPDDASSTEECAASSTEESAANSTGERAVSSPEVQGVGGLVTAAFALGQVAGPLLGTSLTSTFGFEVAAAVMATALVLLLPCIVWVSGTRLPRAMRLTREGHSILSEERDDGRAYPLHACIDGRGAKYAEERGCKHGGTHQASNTNAEPSSPATLGGKAKVFVYPSTLHPSMTRPHYLVPTHPIPP